MPIPKLNINAVRPTEQTAKSGQNKKRKYEYVKIPKTELNSEGRPKVLIPLDTRSLHKEMLKYLPIATRIQPTEEELLKLREKQRRDWAEYEEEQRKLKENSSEVVL